MLKFNPYYYDNFFEVKSIRFTVASYSLWSSSFFMAATQPMPHEVASAGWLQIL